MGGFIAVVRAEAVRTKGSAAASLPWIGLIVAGISFAGILITPQSQERAALLWQTLYVTGMAAPVMVLLASQVVARETNARAGGTAWRASSSRMVALGRFMVLAALSALFHALAFWLVIPLSLAVGAPTDVSRIMWAGAACWIATLGVLFLGFVVSDRFGTIAAFLAACAWQVIGVLAAESASWVMLPPTWAVRAMLPVLGAHQNAEPITAGEPLLTESPFLALALGLLLAVTSVVVTVFGPAKTRGDRAGDNRPTGRRSTQPGALRAVSAVMRGRAVLPLCAVAIVLSIVTAAVYPNTYLLGLHTYTLLPLSACIVAVLTWQSLAPGWRLLVIRPFNTPAAVRWWVLLCISGITTTVLLSAIANALRRGEGTVDALIAIARSGALWFVLGEAGTLAALWVTVRFGAGWTLGGSVILCVVGVTLGGDVLAASGLWIVAPTAWPLSADTPGRFAVAVSFGVVIAVIAWIGCGRAMITAARRGG